MPIPDPYANEPTAEVDAYNYTKWCEAMDAASKWHKEADRIRELLEKQLSGAHAGTVNGKKVLTNRPQRKYAGAAIRRAYPDVAEHFIKKVVLDEFQVDDFVSAHPDLAEPYRIRSFRMVVDPGDDTL